jgi:hypothetical protein
MRVPRFSDMLLPASLTSCVHIGPDPDA